MAGSVLAVIPARGGSKGIPRKNLRELAGRPLIEWSVVAAKAATAIDRIVVSTEDREIAAVARRCGAELIDRPPELAKDESPTVPALKHVLKELGDRGFHPELVVLLEPTSPFRSGAVIDRCIDELRAGNAKTCLTVTQLERNPFNIFTVNQGAAERFIARPEQRFTRRQDFTHLKRVNGCVYAVRATNILDGVLIQDPVRVVEMSAEESINIDTPIDLEFARYLVERGLVQLPAA